CHLKAREIFERNHLRKCLEYALHTAGYQVEVVTGYKVSQKELEAAQEAVQLRKSQEIFKAQPLTEDEANKKARRFDATQQDKTEVTRHRLVSRLPGIENKTQTVSRVVTLPQTSVDEIKSGRVSLETAQKLGIPTPETPSTQSVEVGHLPLNFSINQELRVPVPEGGEVEVVITETKPIFDPEFIRKVKYKNRAWLSQVETHFLLEHPEIAKLLQQRRWYKKLQVFSDPNEPDCVKRLNLTTYKSDWLKVHTLLEMGIEFFLNPESRWTQDSPEAVEFWEKGKDTRRARYIGTTVGDSNPCEYLGRVLNKLDIKRKCDRVKNDAGEKIRVYRVDADYLSSPMRSAVYECIKQRVESVVQTDSLVLNWHVIADNTWANQTVQKLDIPTPETPSTQAIELGHLPPNFSINQGQGVPASERGELTNQPTFEQLVEALPFVETQEDLATVTQHYQRSDVEDAIALHPNPLRQQLDAWFYEQLAQSQEVDQENPMDSLIKIFDSCQSELDFVEVSKFCEISEGQTPAEKEELIESAILYSPKPLKLKLQKWWDCALHQIRDFWRDLQRQELSVLGQEGRPT
ncbi:MAG TPA: hypothetical protein V6D26_11990, partial [Stenomitos sp.]